MAVAGAKAVIITGETTSDLGKAKGVIAESAGVEVIAYTLGVSRDDASKNSSLTPGETLEPRIFWSKMRELSGEPRIYGGVWSFKLVEDLGE